MNERELAICQRVNFARKKLAKWSQHDLANELGITQNQLAGIEYGRSPLRYREAIIICRRFDISQRWLALGVQPPRPTYETDESYSVLVKPKSLFSWVFDGYLDESTKRAEAERIEIVGEKKYREGDFNDAVFAGLLPDYIPELERAELYFLKAINLRYKFLKGDLRLKYLASVADAGSKFWRKHAKELAALPQPHDADAELILENPRFTETSALTNITEIGKSNPVKPQLPGLRQRLNQATSAHGMKAKLAKFMGVPQSNVSQWLSGERDPGGETTLQLLKWVEQQERVQE